MDEIFTIQQCILLPDPRAGFEIVARSLGFLTEWDELALQMAARYGNGKAKEALFARPFGRNHVAIVQVAEVGFHFLIVSKRLYEGLGDPFFIANHMPMMAQLGFMPMLEWPPEMVPQRDVEELHAILKASGDDMSLLLGGAQALVDGSRLLIVSEVPRPDLVYALWQLLPTRTRNELWPSTFDYDNDLDFHVVVLPNAPEPWPMGYLSEEQARDYPQGRYELNLQIAIEAKDQHAVNQLLNRRSSKETLRLALWVVLGAFAIAAVSKLLG